MWVYLEPSSKTTLAVGEGCTRAYIVEDVSGDPQTYRMRVREELSSPPPMRLRSRFATAAWVCVIVGALAANGVRKFFHESRITSH